MLTLDQINNKIDELKERIDELNFMAIEAEGKKLRKIEERIEFYEEQLSELTVQAQDMGSHLDEYYASIK